MSIPTVTIHVHNCACSTNPEATCTCHSYLPATQSTIPAQTLPGASVPCNEETDCADPIGPDCLLWDGVENAAYGMTKGAPLRGIINRLVQEIETLKNA